MRETRIYKRRRIKNAWFLRLVSCRQSCREAGPVSKNKKTKQKTFVLVRLARTARRHRTNVRPSTRVVWWWRGRRGGEGALHATIGESTRTSKGGGGRRSADEGAREINGTEKTSPPQQVTAKRRSAGRRRRRPVRTDAPKTRARDGEGLKTNNGNTVRVARSD